MKGLAWYCRVVFSLFMLLCLVLMVFLLMKFSLQILVGVAVLIIYGVLTGFCFNGTESVLRNNSYNKKWALYGLVWTSFIVVLPFLQLFSTLSHDTVFIFMILTALYEWNFIVFALPMALLFIPAVVFFAKYLRGALKTA